MTTIRCPSCAKLNRVGPAQRGTPRCGSCKSALPWIVDAGDAEFDEQAAASVPVLVDLWAPWCGPCRAVGPTVDRLAQEFASRATVAKLNVDDNPRTAQRFGISGIPALLIFKRGQVVERLVGAQPPAALRQALARHVGA